MECESVKVIWNSFIALWGVIGAPQKFTTKQILFGDVSFNILLNHLILVTKKTIYDCKLLKCIPSFRSVITNVQQVRITERNIPIKTMSSYRSGIILMCNILLFKKWVM